MDKRCVVCGLLFRDGQRIEALIRANYKALKSNIAYALEKEGMEVVPGTIAHAECADDEDNHGPIGFNN
jgi:hypothetical protein